MFFREDMAQIGISVADRSGTLIGFGNSDWYSVEGGNLENDDSHVRPGGMGNEISLGGPTSREDLTLTRPMDDIVFTWHTTLEERVQQDAPTRVTVAYYDRLKNVVAGSAFTFTGTLKSAFLPDMDTSSGDAAMYTLIVSCDEVKAS